MLPATEIKSIAVFRALQLGDLLCSIPALRALRKSFPGAHIALVGLPWMKTLVKRFPDYFNENIFFPGYPGLPEQPFDAQATASFLLEMTKRKFDLVLQMQGNGSIVNPMVELFGARYTAGFCRKNDYKPNDLFFIEYPEGISEVHRHLKLMQHLGVQPDGDHLEFPITPADEQQLESSFKVPGQKFICVHAGSRGGYRQWPPEYFAGVADQCHSYGYEIVLTGTEEELSIVNAVINKMKHKPHVAAGKTSLGAVAALLRKSSGLISNCTGVSHIASALKTKSVVISMDGEPERWAPLNRTLHVTIDWTVTPDCDLVRQIVYRQFASSSSHLQRLPMDQDTQPVP